MRGFGQFQAFPLTDTECSDNRADRLPSGVVAADRDHPAGRRRGYRNAAGLRLIDRCADIHLASPSRQARRHRRWREPCRCRTRSARGCSPALRRRRLTQRAIPAYADVPLRHALAIRSYVGVPLRQGGVVTGTLGGFDSGVAPLVRRRCGACSPSLARMVRRRGGARSRGPAAPHGYRLGGRGTRGGAGRRRSDRSP